MRKSFCDRDKAMESKRKNHQPHELTTFYDEELGMTMQIVGNGLVIPLPMNEEEWQAMVENQAKQLLGIKKW